MVQKTFGIYSEKEEHCRFFIEIGEQHMACWTLSVDYGAWNAFELFRLPETPDKKSYEALFAEVKLVSALIGRSYAATQVIWENPDAVCVPAKYFSEDLLDDYAETVIGATRGTVPRYAVLDDKNLLYIVNSNRLKVVEQQFPGAEHFHKQQLLLKSGQQYKNTDSKKSQVQLLFYEGHFLLAAYQQDQLQLIRSFAYETPEDVVYHLLNTSSLYSLNLPKTIFSIAGLIDLDSSLYAELYKYIPLLQVERADDRMFNNEAFSEYPSHYFIPFFKYVV